MTGKGFIIVFLLFDKENKKWKKVFKNLYLGQPLWHNGTARNRHQCRKTAVLGCHRCLINSGVEKMNNI
jgi:hypothetical protein